MLLLTVCLALSNAGESESVPLTNRMASIGVRSAVVLASQAVDEQPYWSPDGRQLAVNIEGEWWKVELVGLGLKKGTWNESDPIGAADPPPKPSRMKNGEVAPWKATAVAHPRKVTIRGGITVELMQEDLGTVFQITEKGQKPEILWTTSLENCHGLALSPDQSMVAYICELTGVMVSAIDP